MSYGTVKRNEVAALLAKGTVSGQNLAATENAPGTQAASTAVIGQKDSSVGTAATLDIETEEDVVTEASTPDSTLAVWINGVEYKIPLEAV